VDLSGLANLFVRDLLDGAGIFDARHDYRLSPFISNNPATSPGAMSPLVPNPLIGAGVDRATPSGTNNGIENLGGTSLNHHPGLPDGSEECAVHGWDWDCEGFGNQRRLPRNGIMPNPLPAFGTIDIGADQCGGLIMAGYIPSTRMFACLNPQIGITGHDRIFYVDQPNTIGLPRPDAVWRAGALDWFANVQLPPALEPIPCTGSNLTFYGEGYWTSSGLSPRAYMYFNQFFGPTPRHLGCDFGPSLLPDGHGFWDYWMSTYVDAVSPPAWYISDPFATNPIHHSTWTEMTGVVATGPTLAGFFPDNGNLFHNRNGTAPHGPDATWNFLQNQETWAMDAHINPPATLLNLGSNRQFISSAGVFGPFGPCTPILFDTGAWGLNTACPDILPQLALSLAIRINCEIPQSRSLTASNTNLQTFLILANCAEGDPLRSPTSHTPGWGTAPAPLRLEIGTLLPIPLEMGSMADSETYLRAIAQTLEGLR
jgi:hypothetical protein